MKAFISFIEILLGKSSKYLIDECCYLTNEKYDYIKKIKNKRRNRKGKK